MKWLLFTLFVLAVLFASALMIARMNGTRVDYYFFDVLNTTADEVTVSVSLSDLQCVIPPHRARTYMVDHQPSSASDDFRDFTMRRGGVTTTLRSRVDYGRHIVLDVSGTDCIVAADYGPQYRPREMKLPPHTSDILVKRIFHHQQLFLPAPYDAVHGTADFQVTVGLGERLPGAIKVTPRASHDLPEVVRLIGVPCRIVDKTQALYVYLRDH